MEILNETINVGTVIADRFLTRSTDSTTNTFDNIAQYKSISAFPELKYSACNSFITSCKYLYEDTTYTNVNSQDIHKYLFSFLNYFEFNIYNLFSKI